MRIRLAGVIGLLLAIGWASIAQSGQPSRAILVLGTPPSSRCERATGDGRRGQPRSGPCRSRMSPVLVLANAPFSSLPQDRSRTGLWTTSTRRSRSHHGRRSFLRERRLQSRCPDRPLRDSVRQRLAFHLVPPAGPPTTGAPHHIGVTFTTIEASTT